MKDREAWSAAVLGVAVPHTMWQLNNTHLNEESTFKAPFSIIHCPTYFFFLPNLFLTKVQKQYNGQRAAFLTNGAADFGHAKKKKEES